MQCAKHVHNHKKTNPKIAEDIRSFIFFVSFLLTSNSLISFIFLSLYSCVVESRKKFLPTVFDARLHFLLSCLGQKQNRCLFYFLKTERSRKKRSDVHVWGRKALGATIGQAYCVLIKIALIANIWIFINQLSISDFFFFKKFFNKNRSTTEKLVFGIVSHLFHHGREMRMQWFYESASDSRIVARFSSYFTEREKNSEILREVKFAGIRIMKLSLL